MALPRIQRPALHIVTLRVNAGLTSLGGTSLEVKKSKGGFPLLRIDQGGAFGRGGPAWPGGSAHAPSTTP